MPELSIRVLDGLIAVLSNVCLDFGGTAEAVAPVIAAMAGSHEDVRLDDPAGTHGPFPRLLELVVDEELHDGCGESFTAREEE